MVENLLRATKTDRYNFAFIDESAKKEIRRAILKGTAMPGHQIPFASRELPIARGWGTGGLQATMSLIGPEDILKVIDQGSDTSVNAVNLRDLIGRTTGVDTTTDSRAATVIQSRHRIPEIALEKDQVLVLQVPLPEPLRRVEASEVETRRMHAELDYSRMWVYLYEDIVRNGAISFGAGYPVRVARHYIMSPSPIPRWDILSLNQADHITILCAGREKRVYVVPPHTNVEPLEFEDVRFHPETFDGLVCCRCGADDTFLNEVFDEERGERYHICSDTGHCDLRIAEQKGREHDTD